MRAATWVVIAIAANAQMAADPQIVLARARDRLAQRTGRLENYTCIETVNRSYFTPPKSDHRLSCDEIRGAKRSGKYKLALDLTDRLRIDVKVSEGHEIASWVDAGQFASNVLDLVGGGPFGTGPLGTQIADIFEGNDTRFQYLGESTANGETLLEYSYQVPLQASHEQIRAGLGWINSAYSGNFWIDPATYDLNRLTVVTSELPPATGACEVATSAAYKRIPIGDREFLAPMTSTLRFVMTDGSETENVTTYVSCHEYHGEATIRFDDVDADPAGDKKSGAATAPLTVPVGLSFTVALQAPIDTDTAAVGDLVAAVVNKPVTEGNRKQVILPKGSVVRGRITRVQHWRGAAARFIVSMRLESVEIGGVSMPLHAVPDRRAEMARASEMAMRRRGVEIFVPPPGEPETNTSFVFRTAKDRYVIPKGYESVWMTVAGPPVDPTDFRPQP